MTKVALVQVASPDDESPTERIERVSGLLREHAGADLYVLPELWSAGYFNFSLYEDRAETLDGPTVTMVKAAARDLGAHIHLGSIIERDDVGRLFNTAVLVNQDGRIAQTYRKIHVFGYESLEVELLTPGNRLSVVDSPLGPVASTTCYDLRFPGLWQELSTRGAEAVIVPAAWPAVRREHWRVLTQARAIEHQVWVVACGAVGTQLGTVLGGSSRIVDPRGQVLVECSTSTEEVAIIEIDVTLTGLTRADFPVIKDRLVQYADLSSEPGAEH